MSAKLGRPTKGESRTRMTAYPNLSVTVDDLRVAPGSKLHLKSIPASFDIVLPKSQASSMLKQRVEELSVLQNRLHAERLRSVMVVFQGMDAAGKDSTIRRVFSGLNPAGVRVMSYDAPTRDEWQESYLKRHWRDVPSRGFIVVFNRSHYEEVVTPRVFPHLLHERHPDMKKPSRAFWQQRLKDIGAFEEHLTTQNHTEIIKFFLHVSKEEQLKRIKKRLSDPDKFWKFDERDLKSRKSWQPLQNAYNQAINATSTENAPWYVIPADNKGMARLMVAEILLQRLMVMNPAFPEPKSDLSDFQNRYL